ncbi:MAG: pyridoxal-5-phosphate-dependent protein subunit beta [Spirochaeta sp. LUC14_002_19_P3]|nr:MAG: pyridoxal-5-phosphate-dependent protein subunit beta [Spirochaeta sp. LUC14_002_19_P3]
MIDLTLNESQIDKNAKFCAKKDILLPTYKEMADPSRISPAIKAELKTLGRDEVHSRNLYRVSWENEKSDKGGGFTGVNYLEIPSALSGVKARIVGLEGKWFPTGAHKVGAAYSCLAPTLVTGQFNPERNMAVWPSTGNYCRGGAYISRLLGCKSIAILPEEMSKERFDWLKTMADETIATPGCESNVKEIFDKCHELDAERGDYIYIFNQFDQLGNHLWHHEVTGRAMEKVLKQIMGPHSRFAATCVSSGSAGTTASGEYLKTIYPQAKLAVSEALQCPTLLNNGFGGHRIEGIGDKHVPWIHNVKNTDMVVAVDDEHTMRLLRLFNEQAGRDYLKEKALPPEFIGQLDIMGISGICNMITAIKLARYYELTSDDIVLTVFTDSEGMYTSRLKELTAERGPYTRDNAVADYEMLQQTGTDSMQELRYTDRKRIHNLKYYTWVEQQGKTASELNSQWYEPTYWNSIYRTRDKLDELISAFNTRIAHYKKG